MSEANYERQHLAIHAAGYINAAGTSIVTFGCMLTRIGVGDYGLRLDPNNGLVDDESFMTAQIKVDVPASPASSAGTIQALDTNAFFKEIVTTNTAGNAEDLGFEVILWKSVTH